MSMATAFIGPKRATEDFLTGVTQVLIDKKKDRAAWSPSEITSSEVTPKSIQSKFFDPSSPHLSHKPDLNFSPKSTSRQSDPQDSTWCQFRRYGLPSESEVEGAVDGSAPGSGAFKITKGELVERLLDSRGDTGGPRQVEVESWIKGIIGRLCDEKDGYLDWKKGKRDQ